MYHPTSISSALLCPPIYFDIEYEINPWMNKANKVDQPLAHSQWQNILTTLQTLGLNTLLITPQPGLPDMVFTANGGICHNGKFVVSNHKFPERQGEQQHFTRYFSSLGFKTYQLQHYQGGQGDALVYRDTLYAAYGFRSDPHSHEELSQILDIPTVSLRLIDPYFYDFDTAFCPVGNDLIFYYPPAFDSPSQQILSSLPHSYPIDYAAARRFACNSFSYQKHFLTSYADQHMQQVLHQYHYQLHQFDLSEFHKSGGSLKCLILSY